MIVQNALPYDVLSARPLPGVAPLGEAPWFLCDEVYSDQMALRQQLIDLDRDAVIATDAPTQGAVDKMMAAVLGNLPQGATLSGDIVRCPDGRTVQIDRTDPFGTLGRIVQDDICLLEKRGDQHVLTGAVLCFPASWRLVEKIGHPLTDIHGPVKSYTADIARRVQRLFDGVRPGQPLWRFNALWYDDPSLFQPRSTRDPRPLAAPDQAAFLRSERQVIRRLADSDAVLFTIHTFMVRREVLTRGPVAGGQRSTRSAE